MKRLKNIEDKNRKQLDEIEYQEKKQLDTIKNYSAKKESFKELEFSYQKTQKQNEMFAKLRQVDKKIDYSNLVCAHSDGKTFLTLVN